MRDVSCQLLVAMLSASATRWLVWVGLVLLTLLIIALMRSAWGQSRPLSKCIFLSLIAHLLLAIYLTTVNIVASGGGSGDGGTIEVALWDLPVGETSLGDPHATEVPVGEAVSVPTGKPAVEVPAPKQQESAPVVVTPPAPQLVERPPPKTVEVTQPPPVQRPKEDYEFPVSELPKAAEQSKPQVAADVPPPPQQTEQTKLIEVTRPKQTTTPTTTRQQPLAQNQGNKTEATTGQTTGSAANGNSTVAKGAPSGSNSAGGALSGTAPAGTVPPGSTNGVPGPLQLRLAGDHGAGYGFGGNKDTEAAVASALAWLASMQSADGRWNASQLGAGREVMIDGQDRRGAGSQADTGISALALLAFLASGNTHLSGKYKANVQRGLEFLMVSQAPDGNLAGNATLYEKTYCHAMAMFAVSEGLAMTRDLRLEPAVRRAVAYSLAVQDPNGGGWRYQPRDPGDTSQLGWQVMALKSAELSGIAMGDATRQLIARFLASVTSGRSGGLAAYRLGHAPSRAMTAEALVCRQFLGIPTSGAAVQEAADFVIGERPGQSQANVYYWYYGSLALFQLQNAHWKAWNEALQKTLLASQHASGPMAGSWDPDDTWGSYGGRVYATALSALCLEVYYRYLPVQVATAAARAQAPK